MNTAATTDREIVQKPANVLLPWYVGVAITLVFAYVIYSGAMGFWRAYVGMDEGSAFNMIKIIAGFIGLIWAIARFTTVEPYQRLVISQFGRYVGVEKREGLSWLTPLYSELTVSTALSNFETETVKVNDRGGSPIDIGVVVVTRIVDPAKSVYLVDDVEDFVEQQVVASLRTVAASHDYDGEDSKAAEEARSETLPDDERAQDIVGKSRYTLRGDLEEISEELRIKAQEGLGDIGVEIVEVRITHLAYSPEIAAAMLKRQQAQAVVAARETIVKGAVSIIEDTMTLLTEKGMTLDEDRRATLTSNLLVVLSSDREAAPVLPVGS
jgi:regulator of protease activity HflC (stomatin/prohibitin superfamily)